MREAPAICDARRALRSSRRDAPGKPPERRDLRRALEQRVCVDETRGIVGAGRYADLGVLRPNDAEIARSACNEKGGVGHDRVSRRSLDPRERRAPSKLTTNVNFSAAIFNQSHFDAVSEGALCASAQRFGKQISRLRSSVTLPARPITRKRRHGSREDERWVSPRGVSR